MKKKSIKMYGIMQKLMNMMDARFFFHFQSLYFAHSKNVDIFKDYFFHKKNRCTTK